MKELIIIHDKLINYGGAEVVLASLVKYQKPKAIICSCVNDREAWEKFYGVKIHTPILTRFIKTEAVYKWLYPFIISVCYLSSLALTYNNVFFIVYSSSSGKYFRLRTYTNALLYINYHAKGIRNAENYIIDTQMSGILRQLIKYIRSSFLKLEDAMASKYHYIEAISKEALNSLPTTILNDKSKHIGVLHCPTSIIIDSSQTAISLDIPFVNYYVIISRLTPEKDLSPLLDYLYLSSSINLIIIGDGQLLDSFIKKYPKRFFFTGFINTNTKNHILSMSLGLIQPTAQEWSLVTIEANILGVPAIVARSSAIEEINTMISDRIDTPNIIFTNFSELDLAFTLLPQARNYIANNSKRISNIFSEEVFHKSLSKIMFTISNDNIVN